jgi:hypothetical protein
MASFYSDDSISAGNSQAVSNPEPSITSSSITTINNPTTTDFSKSKFNQPDFKLEPDLSSNVYILKNGLFTRTLQPIDNSKEREIILQCTT